LLSGVSCFAAGKKIVLRQHQYHADGFGNYKQFLKNTDDTSTSPGFDRAGSWKVKP